MVRAQARQRARCPLPPAPSTPASAGMRRPARRKRHQQAAEAMAAPPHRRRLTARSRRCTAHAALLPPRTTTTMAVQRQQARLWQQLRRPRAALAQQQQQLLGHAAAAQARALSPLPHRLCRRGLERVFPRQGLPSFQDPWPLRCARPPSTAASRHTNGRAPRLSAARMPCGAARQAWLDRPPSRRPAAEAACRVRAAAYRAR